MGNSTSTYRKRVLSVFDIDILALIWTWLDLVDTRSPSTVCHAFLQAFTRVPDVSICEDDLMYTFEPPEDDSSSASSASSDSSGSDDRRLQLHRVINYVSSRFRHIHTLRVSFTNEEGPSYFHDGFHRPDPDCLSRLLLSCAPELQELDISFPFLQENAQGNAVARALLGPPKQCAFCQKKDYHYSKMSLCGGCRCVFYCSKDCQRKHWRANHRRECATKRGTNDKEAKYKKRLHDPLCTIARHPLRRLGLSNFFIPPSILRRLLGKLITLQGACVCERD